MRKIFFLVAVCCAAMMYAVQAPKNVHWDGTTLKWELPELTNDSVYYGVYFSLFSKTGGDAFVSSIGSDPDTEYDFSDLMYEGRTYFATIYCIADPGYVESPIVTSPEYTVPGEAEVYEVPNVTLTNEGNVAWGNIGYMTVKATIQKKNEGKWDDVASATTTNGWNQSISVASITTPGTYRAVAEGVQGTDVIKRGYSEELIVDELFTVTFDANGLDPFAPINPLTIAKNSVINAPTIDYDYYHQSDGHFFYWSLDKEGDKIWSFETDQVTEDTKLYAQWKELPALNPGWDVDTCLWTLDEKYFKAFNNMTAVLYTEEGIFVMNSGTSTIEDHMFFNYMFPGRKYQYDITLTDFYYNEIVAKSGLHTATGEAEILPLNNMYVDDASTGRVAWNALKFGVYMRHGVLSQWSQGKGEWVEIKTFDDASTTWSSTFIQFDVELDEAEYYRFLCQVNQGEYTIYEGELFYGTNPATALDNASVDTKAVKRIENGQLLIERDGKKFTVIGTELR